MRHRLIEPPAGLLDVSGENPLLAAQRELAEEAGLAAGSWHVLVDLFTTRASWPRRCGSIWPAQLVDVDAPDDFIRSGEEAHMDTVWAPLPDLVDAVLAGDLHNPTMVSGVLAAWAARPGDFAGLRAADAPWPARNRS